MNSQARKHECGCVDDSALERLTRAPSFELLFGLLLIAVTSGHLSSAFLEGGDTLSIHSAHGIGLYGFILVGRRLLKALPFLFMGFIDARDAVTSAGSPSTSRLLPAAEENPHIEFGAGCLIGILAVLQTKSSMASGVSLHSHHAVYLFGCFSALKYLVYLLKSLDTAAATQEFKYIRETTWYRRIHRIEFRAHGHLVVGGLLMSLPLADIAYSSMLIAGQKGMTIEWGTMTLGCMTFLKGVPGFKRQWCHHSNHPNS